MPNFDKQDMEDLNAPAIRVKPRPEPEFEAGIARDRLLAIVKDIYPEEAEDFTDDEIVTLLRFYGKPNESSMEMIVRTGKHLADVKAKRAMALPGDKPAANDPIVMKDNDPGKSPIGVEE